MEYRLIIKKGLTYQELLKEMEAGGRFVIFPWCLSFAAATQQRMSPAIFIPKGESSHFYKWKYALLSLFLGWWGIPWGPIHTIKSIITTCKGGLDATEDIFLNLEEEGFAARVLHYEKVQEIFCKVDKWDRKEFIKALEPIYERDLNIRKVVVGFFINTAEDEAPYYTIGIYCEKDFSTYPDIFRKGLYKRFLRRAVFHFMDMKEETEMAALLEKQGEVYHLLRIRSKE